MSLKIVRTSMILAALAASGTMAVVAPSASAEGFHFEPVLINYVVSGSLTAEKSQQTVTLPEGSTFNGRGSITVEYPLAYGTITGSVFVPPFNTTVTLPVLGTPTPVTVGVTFTQVGQTEGTIKPATGCGGTGICVTLTAPSRADVGFSVVGILGIKVPLHCETSEPIELPLAETLELGEIITVGTHFVGTTTIPPIKCPGLQGIVLGPLLTTALSGPGNPYSISITPPPA